jgi:hypothetical protein
MISNEVQISDSTLLSNMGNVDGINEEKMDKSLISHFNSRHFCSMYKQILRLKFTRSTPTAR